jgi:hypothetical protein
MRAVIFGISQKGLPVQNDSNPRNSWTCNRACSTWPESSSRMLIRA